MVQKLEKWIFHQYINERNQSSDSKSVKLKAPNFSQNLNKDGKHNLKLAHSLHPVHKDKMTDSLFLISC